MGKRSGITAKLGIDLKLTNDFEQYDTELYDRLKHGSNDAWNDGQGWQVFPDGTFIEIRWTWGGTRHLYIMPGDSYSGLFKSYHSNGNIHEKGWLRLSSHMRIGVWYEFDADGNLIAETDYDAPFTFTWEDIVEYCRQNKIKIVNVPPDESEPTHIRREVENGEYIWIISHILKSGTPELIILDGKTGEELCKEKIYQP